MAEKQFLSVTFKFADGDTKIAELKPVFNKATDWFRFSSTCWIIWTGRSAEKWYELLRPHITDKDSMFIVKLDLSERQGWVSKSMWEWLDNDRS
jgi:hypothetical protein